MSMRFLIWVTMDCNLSCPRCMQKFTMGKHKGYQMAIQEINYIVESCIKSNIHFDVIEITGGEPSLWKNIQYGVDQFKKIATDITLATNGNDPELIKSLQLRSWCVSTSQATKEQMKSYEEVKSKLIYNSHKHKELPVKPLENVLPAICCERVNREGIEQRTFVYSCGSVYCCCTAEALTEFVNEDKSIVCSFEDDFISKFSKPDYSKEICKYCICNHKVWNKV